MENSSAALPLVRQRQIIYSQKTWVGFFMDLFLTTMPLVIGGVMIRKIMKQMDPNAQAEEAESKAREDLSAKLRRNGRSGEVPPTNKYEDMIMADMVFPDQIDVSWKSVGGMGELKEAIYETVVLPLQNPGLFRALREDPDAASLATVPRGILFYGPPGTGKTMIAKVIAKDCGATFINVRQSTLQNKWFGESQKLVRALFSLARKCAPTIIFLDEIDLFFRERSGSDHEASSSMKSEFMSLWDGLTTSDKATITVLGATNRPFDIDLAILRRLPRTFLFDLPTVDERKQIIRVCLTNQKQDPKFDFDKIAIQTLGYSGSDLKELCKFSSMLPVRRLIRQQRDKDLREQGAGARTAIPEGMLPAPLSNADMEEGLEQVKATGSSATGYRQQFDAAKAKRNGSGGEGGVPVAPNADGSFPPEVQAQMQHMAAMISQMMKAGTALPDASSASGSGDEPANIEGIDVD